MAKRFPIELPLALALCCGGAFAAATPAAAPASPAPREVTALPSGEPAALAAAVGAGDALAADPPATAEAAPGAASSSKAADAAPSLWIWQTDDARTAMNEREQRSSRHVPKGSVPLEGMGTFVNANAFVDFGMRADNSDWGTSQQNYRNTILETGGDFSGQLFHHNLLSFRAGAEYLRNTGTLATTNSSSSGLLYNGEVNMLEAQPYGFSLYFLRTSTDETGSLYTPFNYTNQAEGIRGKLDFPTVATMTYHLEEAKSDTTSVTATQKYGYRTRVADFSARRELLGATLDFSDNYYRNASSFDARKQYNNFLRGTLAKRFSDTLNANLRLLRSDFNYTGLNGQTSSVGQSTLDGEVRWIPKVTVTTFFDASVSSNSVNALQLASLGSGLPAPPGTLTAVSASGTSASATAGANWQATPHLLLSAFFNYSDAGLNSAAYQNLTAEQKAALIRTTFSEQGSATYATRFGKVKSSTSAGAGHADYTVYAGAAVGSNNYFGSQAFTVGSDRGSSASVRVEYSKLTNPLFFHLFSSVDRVFGAEAQSGRFLRMRVSGSATIDRRSDGYDGSHQSLHRDEYRGNLNSRYFTAYAGYSRNDSNQLLYAFLNGGGVPPTDFSTVLALTQSTYGGIRAVLPGDLQVESSYHRGHYIIQASQAAAQDYWSFDNSVRYKFGRFDLSGGLQWLNTESTGSHLRGSRFYFRIRVPFRLF